MHAIIENYAQSSSILLSVVYLFHFNQMKNCWWNTKLNVDFSNAYYIIMRWEDDISHTMYGGNYVERTEAVRIVQIALVLSSCWPFFGIKTEINDR